MAVASFIVAAVSVLIALAGYFLNRRAIADEWAREWFRVDHRWETQPARNIQQRLRWAAVNGWRLDVRVYFATQHPSKGLLGVAQAELNRMRLP